MQRVNIFNVVYHKVFVKTTQLCHCIAKVDPDNILINKYDCGPKQLCLPKQEVDEMWPHESGKIKKDIMVTAYLCQTEFSQHKATNKQTNKKASQTNMTVKVIKDFHQIVSLSSLIKCVTKFIKLHIKINLFWVFHSQ